MWQATAAAIGAMAFCAVVFVAWGLFGRADDTRPRCARCGADARPVAWSEPPVCACGRRLDRAGAVRSSGRARRPRLLMLGAVAGALALATLVAAGALERRGLAWPDVLPLSFITLNADAGRMWAAESIARRHAAGRLDDATLLSMRDRGAGATEPIAYRLDMLRALRFAEWMAVDGGGIRPLSPEEVDLIRPEGSIGLVIDRPRASEGAPAAMPTLRALGVAPPFFGPIERTASLRILGVAPPFFARVERVLLDGVSLPFSVAALRAMDPHGDGNVFSGPVRLTFGGWIEADAARSRSVVVELLVVVAHAARLAATDPLIGSDPDPAAWGIDGRWMRLRLEATLDSEVAP